MKYTNNEATELEAELFKRGEGYYNSGGFFGAWICFGPLAEMGHTGAQAYLANYYIHTTLLLALCTQ